MNVVARAQLTFQKLALLKNLYRQNQYSKTWDSKYESNGWGFESPTGQEFPVSKTLALSQKYPFVCRKLMLLPRAQLIFQILALFLKI